MKYWLFFENQWHRNYFIRRYFYGPILHAATWIAYCLRFFIPKGWYHLEEPVFVVGCSRSGTTLFIKYFSQHPQVCNWSEAAQIMELDFYNPDIEHLKENLPSNFDVFRIRFWFGLKTRLTGKRVFVNKHPENSLRMLWLRYIFPDARFIHMIRDGMAVTASNFARTLKDPFRKNWPFGQFPKPPAWREYLELPLHVQFAHQWKDVTKYVIDVGAKGLSGDRYLEIHYETFCKDCTEVLRQVDRFVGVDPAKRPVTCEAAELKSRNYKWRQLFSTSQIKDITTVIGNLNVQLGYKDPLMTISAVAEED